MAATSVTDKLFEVLPRWSTTIGSGGVPDGTTTTIPLASTSGLTNGNAYIVTINRVDANGERQSTWETVVGKLSGSNLVNCQRGTEGTAQAWSAGTVVEILMTAEHWNRMVEWAEAEHNQDGTHSDITASSLSTDTINEKTTNAGVTVDGVKHKDNQVYTDQINEKTAGAGITIPNTVKVDEIAEKTAGAGVTVDGVLFKDSGYTASGQPALFLKLATSQTITSGDPPNGVHPIPFDNVVVQQGVTWDTTNYRLTVDSNSAGIYVVSLQVYAYTGSSIHVRIGAWIYKNGSEYVRAEMTQGWQYPRVPVTALVKLVSGDYIDFGAYQYSGSNQSLGDRDTFVSIFRIA